MRRARGRVWVAAVGLALLAVGYSNGVAVLAMRRGQVAESAYRWTNLLALPLFLGLAARLRGMSLAATLRTAGLRRDGWPAGLFGGGLLGLVLAIPPALFFAQPVVLDTPLEYGPIANLSPGDFRRRVLVELPVTIALFEEILFRGLLFDAWEAAAGRRAAYLASSGAFAAWHWAVTLDTVRQTNIAGTVTRLPPVIRAHAETVALGGGLLTTGIAGLVFSRLRQASRGNLLGPVLAHWIVDALMVVRLYRQAGQRGGP